MARSRNKTNGIEPNTHPDLLLTLNEGGPTRDITLHGTTALVVRDFLKHAAQLEESDWRATLVAATSFSIRDNQVVQGNKDASIALKARCIKFFRSEAAFRQVLNAFYPRNSGLPHVEELRGRIEYCWGAHYVPPGSKRLNATVNVYPELREKYDFPEKLDIEFTVPHGVVTESVRITIPAGEIMYFPDDNLDIDHLIRKYEIDETTIKRWLNAEVLHSNEDDAAFFESSGASDEPIFEMALNWRLGGYIAGFVELYEAIVEALSEEDFLRLRSLKSKPT